MQLGVVCGWPTPKLTRWHIYRRGERHKSIKLNIGVFLSINCHYGYCLSFISKCSSSLSDFLTVDLPLATPVKTDSLSVKRRNMGLMTILIITSIFTEGKYFFFFCFWFRVECRRMNITNVDSYIFQMVPELVFRVNRLARNSFSYQPIEVIHTGKIDVTSWHWRDVVFALYLPIFLCTKLT